MIPTGSEFLCVGKNADNRTAYFLILRNLSGLESDVCGQVKKKLIFNSFCFQFKFQSSSPLFFLTDSFSFSTSCHIKLVFSVVLEKPILYFVSSSVIKSLQFVV